MLNEQKRKIIEILNSKNLSPHSFEFKLIEDRVEITHRDSKLDFVFFEHPGNQNYYSYRYSCFTYKRGTSGRSSHELFGIILSAFVEWLDNHVQLYLNEKSEKDPWEELQNYVDLSFPEIDKDDESFSKDEKQVIINRVSKFENSLKERFDLSPHQVNEINGHLKYLVDRVEKLNKRDWKAVAQKVIYDIGLIIIGNSIITKIPNEFWEIVKQVFNVVRQLPPPGI